MKMIKVTINLLVFYPVFQKYMKDACKKQLEEYCSDLLSKYQYGFRQGYATQNCLLDMIEKLEIRKVSFAAVLNDLSKALDCNSQNLLTAKPSDYGSYRKSLIFISAYLKWRKLGLD